MVEVVGVRFKAAGKIYYFSPGELELSASDKAIVETARGVEFGEIVIPPRRVEDEELVLPLKQVIRKATAEDERILEANRSKEKDAFQICLHKIADHGLPMKLIDVEYTFDGNKIIFSFTAEGRVDFRELVKDLAAVFRTRIELRQIGVRDEAKMLGGVGSCGRVLCCASFLGDFEPVSIRMAKDQKLSLNPTKISGICGRLMCCLKYENDCYGCCADREPAPAFPNQDAYFSAEGEGDEVRPALAKPERVPHGAGFGTRTRANDKHGEKYNDKREDKRIDRQEDKRGDKQTDRHELKQEAKKTVPAGVQVSAPRSPHRKGEKAKGKSERV
ncbi:PSP1 C-terminal domain protein [Acididesulfobacillus acetoxydans]|uniref:PSP1 C-terminal domain protein n=1 Tax=Acididesulfobacillus acetoxydans TaxID=1561005 RepID=A0A8S0XUY7_9FIRM|nr:stage 0 sporulation family protein [Acididesulfobacillus acetoxydans]CAA7599867.1 PSP1 C-terminal domain protein [Acididesulfobacillus acetoxydans]CEJ07433.1 Stage 0 sporulation protein YaaT [Acididesulfobacillus acetoxydans]